MIFRIRSVGYSELANSGSLPVGVGATQAELLDSWGNGT
jgi:hypothetical protein